MPSLTKLLHDTHGLGVRPLRVVVDETIDHVAAERLFEIQHVVRDPEHRRAASGVVEVVDTATALGVRRARRCIHLHRHADDVVTCLHQEAGGDRRIDAAAHCGDNPRFAHIPLHRITGERD